MTLTPARRVALLIFLFVVALGFRCYDLSASGFSDDEVYGLRGVQGYQRLEFIGNAEHPMLLKLLELSSMEVGNTWNGIAGSMPRYVMNPETLLRLPNAIFGALMTAQFH